MGFVEKNLNSCRFGLALATGFFLLLWAVPALAVHYDVPIVVETEQDIIDLYKNGDITEEERDRLVELLGSPINLNEADRESLFELPGVSYRIADAILEARDQSGGFEAFADLVDIEVMTVGILGQIRPFVRVVRKTPVEVPIHGKIRLGTLEAFHDDRPPSAFIRTNLGLAEWVDVGWVAFLRQTPGSLSFVPEPQNGDALPYFIADAEKQAFNPLVKLYAATDQRIFGATRLRAIAGSFVAGFGERLTFDTTNRVNPDGWYKDDLIYYNYDRGDVSPRRGLFGGAVTLSRLELTDDIWSDSTAFASWQKQRLYQYQINVFDEDELEDPFVSTKTYFSQGDAEGGDDGCFKEGRCHAYETFEDVYRELVVGGNSSLHFGERTHLGVTGYWAKNKFLLEDGQIHFAPSSRIPYNRSSFWSVGVDGAFGTGPFDLFAEFSAMDTGGLAATARTEVEIGPVDLTVSFRYFDEEFDNPFARARSARDLFFGVAARDEMGGRVRVVAKIFREWVVQFHVDMWERLLAEQLNIEGLFRTDVEVMRGFKVASWVKVNDKDITKGGRDEDYGESFDYGYEGSTPFVDDYSLLVVDDSGRGMKVDWGSRVTLTVIPLTRLSAYFKLKWADVSVYDDKFETSYVSALTASVAPIDKLRLRTRIRLEDEDIDDDGRGDSTWQWYLQLMARPTSWLSLSLRYDFIDYYDDNPPEEDPEHLLRATVDFKF